MLHKLLSIFDSKAINFQAPNIYTTVGAALRALQQVVADPKHDFCKYAEDFILFELGSINVDTGVIVPAVPIINHGSLLNLKPSRTLADSVVNDLVSDS